MTKRHVYYIPFHMKQTVDQMLAETIWYDILIPSDHLRCEFGSPQNYSMYCINASEYLCIYIFRYKFTCIILHIYMYSCIFYKGPFQNAYLCALNILHSNISYCYAIWMHNAHICAIMQCANYVCMCYIPRQLCI